MVLFFFTKEKLLFYLPKKLLAVGTRIAYSYKRILFYPSYLCSVDGQVARTYTFYFAVYNKTIVMEKLRQSAKYSASQLCLYRFCALLIAVHTNQQPSQIHILAP